MQLTIVPNFRCEFRVEGRYVRGISPTADRMEPGEPEHISDLQVFFGNTEVTDEFNLEELGEFEHRLMELAKSE